MNYVNTCHVLLPRGDKISITDYPNLYEFQKRVVLRLANPRVKELRKKAYGIWDFWDFWDFGDFGISWIFWDFRDLLGFIGIFWDFL